MHMWPLLVTEIPTMAALAATRSAKPDPQQQFLLQVYYGTHKSVYGRPYSGWLLCTVPKLLDAWRLRCDAFVYRWQGVELNVVSL
eukprot:8152355-Pyramimonas_sp.AAC.1